MRYPSTNYSKTSAGIESQAGKTWKTLNRAKILSGASRFFLNTEHCNDIKFGKLGQIDTLRHCPFSCFCSVLCGMCYLRSITRAIN